MISTLKKKLSKKGFTLAELLIVVAIIAVLVAIAIPVFSGQLAKAKAGTDLANLRSAISVAQVEVLTNSDASKSDIQAAIDAALPGVKAVGGDKTGIVADDGIVKADKTIDTTKITIGGQTYAALQAAAK